MPVFKVLNVNQLSPVGREGGELAKSLRALWKHGQTCAVWIRVNVPTLNPATVSPVDYDQVSPWMATNRGLERGE